MPYNELAKEVIEDRIARGYEEEDKEDIVRRRLTESICIMAQAIDSLKEVVHECYSKDTPLERIIELHEEIERQYVNINLSNIEYLSEQVDKNKDAYIKAINFYLKDAYLRYGIDEEVALEIMSKIARLPKEELRGMKNKDAILELKMN